jgi:hypothetical protein
MGRACCLNGSPAASPKASSATTATPGTTSTTIGQCLPARSWAGSGITTVSQEATTTGTTTTIDIDFAAAPVPPDAAGTSCGLTSRSSFSPTTRQAVATCSSTATTRRGDEEAGGICRAINEGATTATTSERGCRAAPGDQHIQRLTGGNVKRRDNARTQAARGGASVSYASTLST